MIKSAIENRDCSELVERFLHGEASVFVERENSDGEFTPFLNENGNAPVAGAAYSNFYIKSFNFDKNTFLFDLEADIDLTEQFKEAELFADVHNISESTNDFLTDPKTEGNTKGFIYKTSGNLEKTFNGHNQDAAVIIVFARLTDMSGAVTHIAVMKNVGGLKCNLDLEHPRNQTPCMVIGNGNDRYPSAAELTDEKPLFEKDPLKVTIAFYRMPSAAELADVDYLCNFGKMPGNHPVLAVPTEGTLTLTGGEFVKDGVHPEPKVTCYLADPYGGVIVTGSSEYKKSIQWDFPGGDKRKLHFYLVYDSWGIPYMEPGGFAPKKFSYTIAIEFYRVMNNVYSGPFTLQYSSGMPLNETGSGEKADEMPFLIIAWGCLEESTEILMDDGTNRKIKDIFIGDRVRLADGKAAVVKNVWYGTDERLFRITAENGISVAATYNHPFLSENGWKLPPEMRVGDMLIDASGNMAAITKIEEIHGRFNVVNLELEEPAIIVANGLRTGDYDAQNGRFPD